MLISGALYPHLINRGVGGLHIKSKEVEKTGNRVTEIEETGLIGSEYNVFDRLNYMVIWKKSHGTRLIHRQIWNSVLK